MNPVIGFTSTIPIEVILAAGYTPVDLNNLFVSDLNKNYLVKYSELYGLPSALCGWLKGIFGAVLRKNIERVVVVSEGDCTGSVLLSEFLRERGVEVYEFSYPIDGARHVLNSEIEKFANYLNVTMERVFEKFFELMEIRKNLIEIDTLTYKDGIVSGFENFYYLISGSDMKGDPLKFSREVKGFLNEVKRRNKKFEGDLRVGFIGVPTLITDFFDVVEGLGGYIVFNETARQFSLSFEAKTLLESFVNYTYPYGVERRIEDINREVEKRGIDCLIHNVQSFCFHNFEDEIFKRELNVPILKIESNFPSKMSERDKIRLENFFSSLKKVPGTKKKVPGTKKSGIGIDFGSRWVKVVFFKKGAPIRKTKIDTIKFYKNFCYRKDGELNFSWEKFLCEVLEIKNLKITDLQLGITGYGKGILSKIRNVKVVPEILAHVKGAIFLTGRKNFTLLDIGGQDTKVALVRNGKLMEFKMNDKCAAGSGRYIENISRVLDVPLEEFGKYSGDGVYISSICATYGETEVVSRIAEGYEVSEICSGVNRAVVRRILPHLIKLSSDTLIITGGISKNFAIRKIIEEEGIFKEILVLEDSEYCGAIGTLF